MSTGTDATILSTFFTIVAIFTFFNNFTNASQWKSQSLSSYPEESIGRRSNPKVDTNVGDHDDEEESRRNFVSPHETPREAPVKVRINGDLATPPPDSDIQLGFVPKQTYYQVRRYDTKVHLPRSAAVEEAETVEELLNAPRLREVVSHKKTQQVYEEQGYEDAAYDHGGYKKAGEKYENKHLAPPSSSADTDYASDSNRRARIDNQSQEQTHVVESARLENTTDGDADENDHSVEFDPKRGKKDEKTKHVSSGEKDEDEDDDHRRQHPHNTAVTSRYRPKVRTTVRSRLKANKNGDSEESKTQSKPPHPVSYMKRRRKNNDNANDSDNENENPTTKLGSDTKTAQESKNVRSKLKVTTRRVRPDSLYGKGTDNGKAAASLESDFVTPTTYRPSTLPERLTLRLKSSAKRKPLSPLPIRVEGQPEDLTLPAPSISSSVVNSFAKNTLVDSSGYVFENPFASHHRNSHDSKYPFTNWKSAASTTAYSVNERPLEYNQTPLPLRSYDKTTASAATVVAEAKSKYLRSKLKTFPYEIINARHEPMTTAPVAPTRSAINDDIVTIAKWRKKAMASADTKFKKMKPDFPYEIVTAASSAFDNDSKRSPEKYYRWPRKRPKYARFKNVTSPFGTADDSPWIPITPKEAYDIHGYPARRKNSMAGSGSNHIQVTENEPAIGSTTEMSPVNSKRRKMNPIRVVEAENENAMSSKGTRSLARTVSTSYSILHEYDATPVNWVDKPTHRFEGWWTTSSPPEINQSFDSQRKLFEDTLRTRTPSSSTVTTEVTTAARTASSREWTDEKDIETLSSNRYTVFQPFEYTTSSATPSPSLKTDDKPLLNRHPYLPRETWHLEPETTANPQLKTFTATHGSDQTPSTAATANRNYTAIKHTNEDRRLDKIIVYPASTVAASDYALSAASFVQNLTLAHYADPSNSVRASLPPNYRDRFNTLTDHLVNKATSEDSGSGSRKIRSASANQEMLNLYMDGSTTEIAVDLHKYPFYKSVSESGRSAAAKSSSAGNPLAKYSVLRYISNPNLVPTKTAGQMSFYQSRNRVECPEPDAPENVIPERERDGDWVGDDPARARGEPRVRNVGRSILCHKIKFFGSDPLDNPFFQEESVGFPLIFPTSPSRPLKKKSKSKRAAILTGTNANDPNTDSIIKKTGKVHLAGGFMNVRDYNAPDKKIRVDVPKAENSSTVIIESTSTTMKTTIYNLDTTIPQSSTVATTATSFFKDPVSNSSSDSIYQKFSSDFRFATDKSKKKVYTNIDVFDRAPLKPQYKEPSWRNKKRQQGTGEVTTTTTMTPSTEVAETDNHAASNSRVDSLLYVIHPESGRGKWMKILKVEQLPGSNASADAKATTKKKSSDGIKFRPKQTSFIPNVEKSDSAAEAATGDRFASNEHVTRPNRDSCGFGFGFGFGRQSPQMTQQTETKRTNVPVSVPISLPAPQATHPTYHISGLLRQVAPLKASQVEINNLQTTAAEENLEQDVDGDEGEARISPSSSPSIQPRYKHRDHVQFLQPHERLYYYVVDE